MKTNVEIKVNVSLSFEEVDFLSTVLCGLTSYPKDDLKRMLNVKEINRYGLESLAIQFGKLYTQCYNMQCYNIKKSNER